MSTNLVFILPCHGSGCSSNLWPRRLGFDPRPINVRLVLDKVALGPSTSVFTWQCHYANTKTHLHLNSVILKGGSGRSLGSFEQSYARLVSRGLFFRILVFWAVALCGDVNRSVLSKRRDLLTLLHSVTSQKIVILKEVFFWMSGSRGQQSTFAFFLLVCITK